MQFYPDCVTLPPAISPYMHGASPGPRDPRELPTMYTDLASHSPLIQTIYICILSHTPTYSVSILFLVTFTPFSYPLTIMAKSKTKTRTTTQSPSSPAPTLLPQTATAPSSPRRSLLQQTCKFLNTTAGLDLSLRLIHGLVIISAQASSHELVATRSVIASWQLNLGTPTPSLHPQPISSTLIRDK